MSDVIISRAKTKYKDKKRGMPRRVEVVEEDKEVSMPDERVVFLPSPNQTKPTHHHQKGSGKWGCCAASENVKPS